ncbi:uncharacterized protein VTP21DRAFT_1072 [Calcarisporiella thermophila]|uniref:uncharacterized protein n=1 Tax=Calcarisporiella thermophila TaxID=911321 RepID=UPI0037426034
MAAKLVQITKDIEASRCNAKWNNIPELARRYRKYSPEDTAFADLITAECEIVKQVNHLVLEQKFNYTSFMCDNPQHLSLSPRVPSESIADVVMNLLQIEERCKDDLKNEAKIIITRAHYSSGDWEKALQLLSDVTLSDNTAHSGYLLVQMIQVFTMKGVCLEMLGSIEAAIEAYDRVASLLQQTSERCDQLNAWAEEALYRAPLLKMRLGLPENAVESFRVYYEQSYTWPLNFRVQKRIVVLQNFSRVLSEIYRMNKYTPPVNPSGILQGIQSIRQELAQIHSSYEQCVRLITPCPKSGELNVQVLELVDQVVSCWDMLGGTLGELRNVVDLLYRSMEMAFNSPRILRHLVKCLSQLGDYDEAEHALNVYLEQVGMMKEEDQPSANAREDIKLEKEEDGDIVDVMLIGCQLMAKDLEKPQRCVELAQKACTLCRKSECGTEREAEAFRYLGVGNSMLSCEAFDPDTRRKHQEEALSALNHSLTLAPKSYATHYQLALQYAEMRDIPKAILTVRQSLSFNPLHTPSWHLLALLFSCPCQNDLEGAARWTELGLAEVEWPAEVFANPLVSGEYVLPPTTNPTPMIASEFVATPTLDAVERSEEILALKMTEAYLQDKMNGPSLAIRTHENLFKLFSRVYPHDPMDWVPEQGSEPGAVATNGHLPIGGSASNLSVRPATRMNRSRSFVGSASGASVNGHEQERKYGRDQNGHLTEGRDGDAQTIQTSRSRRSKSFLGNILGGKEKKNKKSSGAMASTGHDIDMSISTDNLEALKNEEYAPSLISSQPSSRSRLSVTPSVYATRSLKTLNGGVDSPTFTNSTGVRRDTKRARLRRERAQKVLLSLWLLSASAFRRAGKLEEARKALEEAEAIGSDSADLWYQTGALLLQESKTELARSMFHRALAVDPHHVEAKVAVAKGYLAGKEDIGGELDLAEGLLESVTQGAGWNNSEAWVHLAKTYQLTDRWEQSKTSLWYALDLESTRPVRPFRILPRCA